MSDELLQAMCEAYWKAAPGITSSMRNILELLHANGYRRCAEGQRVTQWCDRAEKAEAEVERLRAVIDFAPHQPNCASHYAVMVDGICAPGEVKRPRSVQRECDCWKRAARGES